VRIKFDELAKTNMPRSSTARFSERWQKSVGDDGFLDSIVERWRASSSGTIDNSIGLSLLADSMGSMAGDDAAATADQTPVEAAAPAPAQPPAFSARMPRRETDLSTPLRAVAPTQAAAGAPAAPAPRSVASLMRREPSPSLSPTPRPAAPAGPPAVAKAAPGGALRSLREKLLQKS
jgi:hypothetical protein